MKLGGQLRFNLSIEDYNRPKIIHFGLAKYNQVLYGAQVYLRHKKPRVGIWSHAKLLAEFEPSTLKPQTSSQPEPLDPEPESPDTK